MREIKAADVWEAATANGWTGAFLAGTDEVRWRGGDAYIVTLDPVQLPVAQRAGLIARLAGACPICASEARRLNEDEVAASGGPRVQVWSAQSVAGVLEGEPTMLAVERWLAIEHATDCTADWPGRA